MVGFVSKNGALPMLGFSNRAASFAEYQHMRMKMAALQNAEATLERDGWERVELYGQLTFSGRSHFWKKYGKQIFPHELLDGRHRQA